MRRRIFSGLKQLYFVLLYLGDVFAFLASAYLACFLLKADFFNSLYVRFIIFSLLIFIVNQSAFGLYRDKRNLFDDNDFMQLLYSVILTVFILIIFIFIFDPWDSTLFALMFLSLLFAFILSALARFVLGKIVFISRKAGYDQKRVLFFGAHNDELIQKINENPSLGYKVVKTTNDIAVLKKFLSTVDIVFLHMEHIDEKMLEFIIGNEKIQWKIIPPVLNLVIDPVRFDEFRDYPIINVSNTKSASNYVFVKRIFDIAASGLSLIILSPLFLFIAVMIKATMPGPVFFKQERLGKNLKPFLLYKFRTMVVDADKLKSKMMKQNEVKGLFKMKDDPRITKFGKFLRRTNFDELAQLINIFKGSMSIVGPRPHLQIELKNFSGWRMARFSVKPGLTGLWQVNGRHELNFDKAVLYDIYYIKHMSLLADITIILKTIPSIVMSRGKY